MSLDASLLTGNLELDRQHMALVSLLDQVQEATTAEQCLQLLKKLCEDMHEHFLFEESIMHRKNYPVFDEHCANHAKIVRQFENELRQHSESALPATDFLKSIAATLNEHIQKHDKHFTGWLKAGA